jgi:4-amino-4-deoxy-L-arabinose transferase-like glycosyltransferase
MTPAALQTALVESATPAIGTGDSREEQAPTSRSRTPRALALLSGLWVLLFFASLFAPPVLDDADGTHANAARQMAISGDWVTLRVNNVRYMEKAPLPYWLVAISFRLFGFNAFAAHLPEAIGVLLLAFLGYRWAREAFGDRAALYTGLAVLTSAGVFLFTRIFIPDLLLSLLLATALYCFLHALTELHARRYAYALWAALGLAVLTKGLVAIVFLFGTAALYVALTGENREWRRLRPFTGILLFFAIAAPWHILAGVRNPAPPGGHGFFWFYFVNEHVLRFLGRRIPMDYNKLPGYLYWSLHIVWLFPWALFAPIGLMGLWRKLRPQTPKIDSSSNLLPPLPILIGFLVLSGATFAFSGIWTTVIVVCSAFLFLLVVSHRLSDGLRASPFYNLTFRDCTTLLLSVFTALVLLFFSLSTNQEYYTFPAYLPLLMLIAAALARAEQTMSPQPATLNPVFTLAHAALTAIGLAIAAALAYGLWTSRNLSFVPDIGALLAHRGVGDYTLSMSSLFDLTGPSFAALRLPAFLALVAFAIGPAVAWLLRARRYHLAATTAIAVTSAIFLIAAHIALGRFAPMLSSQDMAARIESLEAGGAISRRNTVLLFGDQAYGSSLGFYLNRPLGEPVRLVEGRSSSMLFGSTFPDAHGLFLTSAELLAQWGQGERKLLFVPLERRDEVDRLLGPHQLILAETSGKALLTDRPLDR